MDAVSSTTNSSVSEYLQEIIQRRQMNQAERLAKGVSSGQLSQSEADKIGKFQTKIDQMDQKAMADGTMSASEFARIMHAQDKGSRQIHRLKHNAETAQGSDTQAASTLASNAGFSISAAASNAPLSFSAFSNAGGLGTTIMADMNKLFQDIAQGLLQDRQARMDKRIQAGVDSGGITPQEQQTLSNLESQAASTLSSAQSDGTITAQEFVQVLQAQNAVRQNLRQYYHDQRSASSASSGTQGSAVSSSLATALASAVSTITSNSPPPNYKPFSGSA